MGASSSLRYTDEITLVVDVDDMGWVPSGFPPNPVFIKETNKGERRMSIMDVCIAEPCVAPPSIPFCSGTFVVWPVVVGGFVCMVFLLGFVGLFVADVLMRHAARTPPSLIY